METAVCVCVCVSEAEMAAFIFFFQLFVLVESFFVQPRVVIEAL